MADEEIVNRKKTKFIVINDSKETIKSKTGKDNATKGRLAIASDTRDLFIGNDENFIQIGGLVSGTAEHSLIQNDADCVANGKYSVAEGHGTITNNEGEKANGSYNVSKKNSDTFGDAKNTAWSLGIGKSSTERKNAIEVMQNGDVYVYGLGGYDGTNAGANGINTLQAVVAPYKQVQYLNCAADCYFDTGMTVTGKTRWEFDCNIRGVTSQWQSGTGYSSDYVLFVAIETNSMTFYCGNSVTKSTTTTTRRNWIIDQVNHQYGYEGSLSTNSNIQSITNSRSIYLNARHSGNSASYTYNRCYIYGSKIFDNGVLKQELIPVKLTSSVIDITGVTRNSGYVGMWDKVNGKLYPHLGSGTCEAVE